MKIDPGQSFELKQSKLKVILFAGILAALSFVLMRFTEFPLLPAATFLKTDLGDIPLLIGAIYLGPIYGIAIAFTKDLLYLLSGGGSGGLLGAFINFIALGTFSAIVGLFSRKRNNVNIILGLIFGTLLMALVMIPVNLWAVPTFWMPKITHKALMDYILKLNLPFNLIKGAIDTIITFIVFVSLKNRYKGL